MWSSWEFAIELNNQLFIKLEARYIILVKILINFLVSELIDSLG